MKLNSDSPELTAYALGELDPSLLTGVEAALAADPTLLAEVAAIQAAAGDLTQLLAAESPLELRPAQRARIEAAVAGQDALQPTDPKWSVRAAVPWWRRWSVPRYGWGIALAGVGALALTLKFGGQTAQDVEADFVARRYTSVSPTRPVAAATNGRTVASAPTQAPVPATRLGLNRALPAGTPPPPSVAPARPSPGLAGSVPPAAAPVPPPVSAPAVAQPMEPALMKRYGLTPAPGGAAVPSAPAPSPGPAPAQGLARQNSPVTRSPVPTLAVQPDARNRVMLSAKAPADALHKAVVQSSPMAPSRGLALETARPLSAGRLNMSPSVEAPVGGIAVMPAPGEGYAPLAENPFRLVSEAPLSTFGLDVDTASYANVRRFLREGVWPPADAVRIEEMVNYFPYSSQAVPGNDPVTARVDVFPCPWREEHRLVRVVVKAREVVQAERPPANLVFLVDVSGSMQPENKLPLVQRSLRLLTERLTARDSVAVVTYAGDAGVALPPSNGAEKAPILAAIDALKAGGSTHGSAGIRTAYDLARSNLFRTGVNRVILCTDGDFNVGLTSHDELLALITEQAKSGIFLSVLGYGMGNFQDATTELLADRGNGNYAYIDTFREAQKVLSHELESTLVTVAKDVKLQLEFNPERVVRWRLLGYENRLLADRDFNDDTKDAGDLGAGHQVTALYELVPTGGVGPGVDPLRYAASPAPVRAIKAEHANELLNLKLRYKEPQGDTSKLLQWPVKDESRTWAQAEPDARFAVAVAGFGLLLRNSEHKGTLTFEQVLRLAEQGLGTDREGYRAEFVDLVRRAQSLRPAPAPGRPGRPRL